MSSIEVQPRNPLDRIVVLIPAWQPDFRLSSLVQQLTACGFAAIVVVDDGSGAAFTSLFDDLVRFSSLKLLRQPQNRGKGSALKLGIDFVCREMPDVQGIVTADADGQHAVQDILRVAEALSGAGESIILGTRIFTGTAPARCRVGNWITRKIFRLLTGVKLADTQSGLRGLPRNLFDELLQLPGTRYEYEMVMLAHLCRTRRPPVEVPIQTLYLDGNASSHFKPFADSLRVLLALFRSAMSR